MVVSTGYQDYSPCCCNCSILPATLSNWIALTASINWSQLASSRVSSHLLNIFLQQCSKSWLEFSSILSKILSCLGSNNSRPRLYHFEVTNGTTCLFKSFIVGRPDKKVNQTVTSEHDVTYLLMLVLTGPSWVGVHQARKWSGRASSAYLEWSLIGVSPYPAPALRNWSTHEQPVMPFSDNGPWQPVLLPEQLSLDEHVFVIRFTSEVINVCVKHCCYMPSVVAYKFCSHRQCTTLPNL